jgi:uncharacterized protein YkwD
MGSKRLLPALIFLLLFTAACSPKIPQTGASTSSTAPATSAAAAGTSPLAPVDQPQPTPTPPPQPTATPQAQAAPAAQSPSNCTDSASFVADVTIPDNSNVNAGSAFVKTWRIRNTGTCSWNEAYSMVFVNGDQMNSIASIPFKVTAPGDTLDLSVDLVGPSSDGAYTGNYELHNPAGQLFQIDGTRFIWVKISVSSGVAQKPVPAGTNVAQQPGAPASSNPSMGAPNNGTAGTCGYFEDSGVENDLLSQVNAVRAAYDLPPLNRNAKLSAAALDHSIDMACHSSISHSGSDGSSITGRIAAHGYSYSYWNEAIYAQPPEYGGNAQAAVEWWLNDPPHRVIILSADAKDIGTGYAYVAGSKLGGYFTIDLGSPAP